MRVRRVDIICKFASETDDETDTEHVDRLWRFLERETRNERKGRGTVGRGREGRGNGAERTNGRTGNANKHR